MPTTTHRPQGVGKPVWELAERFPPQGKWEESDYIALDRFERAQFIELVDGCLEFLPMPSMAHQRIARHLFRALDAYCRQSKTGEVFYDGTRAKLREGEIRLPDIVFVAKSAENCETEDYLLRADLVMEVVSKGAENRERDLVEKRNAYARAGIAEYWIVDPQKQEIAVLVLRGTNYAVHRFKAGRKAESALLKGFAVDVRETLAGAKE